MTPWNPWFNSDRDDEDLTLHPLPWRWDEVLAAQQRFWTECTEASQIWLSWWVSALPPMNWPPTGVVLPPGSAPVHSASLDTQKTSASRAAVAHKTQKAHEAPTVRHH